MSESDTMEIEQGRGTEVAHFVYRVPKKNRDAMMQLNKQFVSIMRKYGATHLVFQLNSIDIPMEGITNISKALSAKQDEEVWGRLFQQSLDLLAPGSSFIMGEFSRLKI
jgi:Protein of unknown function (DUF1428)